MRAALRSAVPWHSHRHALKDSCTQFLLGSTQASVRLASALHRNKHFRDSMSMDSRNIDSRRGFQEQKRRGSGKVKSIKPAH
eukprot:226034-Pleurochrysis_carterae.AAC.2